MEADLDLLSEFPLRVVYPYGGRHHVLRWYSRTRGYNLLIGREASSVDAGLRRVLARAADGDEPLVCDHLLVDVVAPNRAVREAYAREALLSEQANFWATVLHLAECCKDGGLPLPPSMTCCTTYTPRPEASSAREVEDRWHHHCAACQDGYRLEGETAASLYLRQRKVWRQQTPERVVAPPGRPSRAPEPDPRRPLLLAARRLGSAASAGGATLGATRLEGAATFLFFYHEVEPLSCAAYEALVASAREARKAQERIEEAKRKAWQRDRPLREQQALFALLAPSTPAAPRAEPLP